jgi:hypothetical protein
MISAQLTARLFAGLVLGQGKKLAFLDAVFKADPSAVCALPSHAGAVVARGWDVNDKPDLPGVFGGDNKPQIKDLEAGVSYLSHLLLRPDHSAIPIAFNKSNAGEFATAPLYTELIRKPGCKIGSQSSWACKSATIIGHRPFSQCTMANMPSSVKHT